MLNSENFALFNKQLSDIFSDINCLSKNHTLAACDYFDTYKHFPEEEITNLEFVARLDGWDEQSKLEIERERICKVVTNKSYHWSNVEPNYMERHWSGIYYLNSESFKFYLASWMYSYFSNYERMGVISACFFKELENFLTDESTVEIVLSEDQKKLVATFMLAVVQANTSESVTQNNVWIWGGGITWKRIKKMHIYRYRLIYRLF